MEVYESAHSVYRLQYHGIWVCQYRKKILNPGMSGDREHVIMILSVRYLIKRCTLTMLKNSGNVRQLTSGSFRPKKPADISLRV